VKLEGKKRDRLRIGVIVALVVGGFVAFQQIAPNIDIEGLLEDLAEELGEWTYALVGLLAFLETGAFVGLVFPGETAVILGGAVAGQGELSVILMIAVVWSCAWAGDSVSFVIGNRLGREFVLRHGPKVRITRERFEQVEAYFARHGGKTILVGRFIGLVRALAPFIAGSSGMRYRAFVPFSIIGTGLWAATFTLLGYVLSESLDRAAELAGRGTFVFGATVAVIVGAVLLARLFRKPENRARVTARIEATPGVRRLLPQIRFVWGRITPGGLGLEFTTLVATLSVSLFVLVGYALSVAGDPAPTVADREAVDVVEALRAGWLTDIAEIVSALGSTAFTLAVAAIAGGALVIRRRIPEAVVLLAALVIVHVAVPVLKEVIDRPRPEGGLVETTDQSFPSGHATYAVLYTWLALTVTVRVRPGLTYASAAIVAGIAVTAAIGLSRVYLGVHYLSDVNAGWALGVSAFAGCAAVAMIITHFRNLRQNQRS
jgi:membrane protein DedA with SNARE-associated domain/membrane-associated phospholipid phosphatase